MVPPRPGIGFNPHPHSPFGHYGFHNHGYRPQPINVFMNNGVSNLGSSLLSLGWASFGVNTVLSLVGMFLPNQFTSNWSFGAGWGGGFSGAGWAGSSFSARSTTTIKAELTDYNRIYQYKSEYGGDINKARDHLKTVIDDADKLLTEKKGEKVEDLTFGKFLSSLPKESQDAIKTLVNKKDDDKMTYGDVQDLKQRLEAHLKNGSIVKQDEFDKLFKPYEADLKYMDDLKAFKDQKEKDLNLMKKMNSFDDIDKKRDALKNELSLSPQEKAQMTRLKGKIDEVRAKYNDTPDSKTHKKQRLGEELAKLEAAYTKLEEKEKAANKAINDSNQLGLKLPKKPAAPTDTKPADQTRPADQTEQKPAATAKKNDKGQYVDAQGRVLTEPTAEVLADAKMTAVDGKPSVYKGSDDKEYTFKNGKFEPVSTEPATPAKTTAPKKTTTPARTTNKTVPTQSEMDKAGMKTVAGKNGIYEKGDTLYKYNNGKFEPYRKYLDKANGITKDTKSGLIYGADEKLFSGTYNVVKTDRTSEAYDVKDGKLIKKTVRRANNTIYSITNYIDGSEICQIQTADGSKIDRKVTIDPHGKRTIEVYNYDAKGRLSGTVILQPVGDPLNTEHKDHYMDYNGNYYDKTGLKISNGQTSKTTSQSSAPKGNAQADQWSRIDGMV